VFSHVVGRERATDRWEGRPRPHDVDAEPIRARAGSVAVTIAVIGTDRQDSPIVGISCQNSCRFGHKRTSAAPSSR